MKKDKEGFIIKQKERPLPDFRKLYKTVKKKIFAPGDRSPVQDVKAMKRINEKMKELKMSKIDEILSKMGKHMKKESLYVDVPVAVTADYHVPYTSREWVEKLVRISLEQNIKRLIIGGDYFNHDAFNHWFEMGFSVSWEEELVAAQELLNSLLNFFETIYIFLGNHDIRILRRLEERLDMKRVFGLILDESLIDTRVFVSNLEYCYTSDKKWMISHPGSYSRRSTTVSVKMAEKEATNVVCGHGHHLGFAYTNSGKFVAIEGGGMFDKNPPYRAERSTTNPEWNNGFVILNEKSEAKIIGKDLAY